MERGHQVTPFTGFVVCYHTSQSMFRWNEWANQLRTFKWLKRYCRCSCSDVKTSGFSVTVSFCVVVRSFVCQDNFGFKRFTRQTIIKRRLFWHQGRESIFVWHRRARVFVHLLHRHHAFILTLWLWVECNAKTWHALTWHETTR